jgi:ribonuclease D
MDSPRKHKWAHGRSVHRQHSHDAIHAGAAEAPLPAILQHSEVASADPLVITSQQALHDHLRTLHAAGRFAYDTEFIGEHSYHAKLCVVQTATRDSVAIIDPLADDIDLTPLWELLADASVEKIVHAGEQDLEPVDRHLGRPPANVIDTQILAAFAGLGYPTGMAKLLRDLLGADPGHGLTFSQWDRRPLTRVQMMYAANDVRYLPLLRDTIFAKAEALGNHSCAIEECGVLCSEARYRFDASAQRLRVRGVESLGPRELAILTELVAWREDAAQTQDVPPRALLRDSILLAMARYPSHTLADLDRIVGLPRPVENRWGKAIIEATQRGLTAPLLEGYVPADRYAHRRKIDRVWDRIQKQCESRSIHPAIVASKREVAYFVRAVAVGMDRQRAAGRLLTGWRAKMLQPALWSSEADDDAGHRSSAHEGDRDRRPHHQQPRGGPSA